MKTSDLNTQNEFYRKPLNILIIAVIATALWGSAFPAIKIGYELFEITNIPDKLLFAGVRFVSAGVLVLLFSGFKKVPRESVKDVLLLGFVQTFLEYIFFYISLTYLTGVKGSVLNSIGNFFAVILAHFMLQNDKINSRKFIGCVLGFAGVVICNLEGGWDFSFSFMGEGFIIIAAFCFALGSVMTKKITKNAEPFAVTGVQLAFGGVLLTAVGLIFGGSLTFTGIKAVLMLCYLAVLSAAAFSLWSQLLKYNPVGKISIYCFLNPVFGVILSGIFLGEDFLNLNSLLALALVSVGIYVVNKSDSVRKE